MAAEKIIGYGQSFLALNSNAAVPSVGLDSTASDKHTLTADQDISVTITNAFYAGQELTLILTCDSSARTITWGAGILPQTATLAMTASKQYIVKFMYDGTNWLEVTRTTAL